jgi:hypothetical protein
VHHFFRRIPEARWRETARARSDISTLSMMLTLVFALSRQKTSIKSHEQERPTSRALLPAPCSPCSRSRFQVKFAGLKRRRRDPPRELGDADRHTWVGPLLIIRIGLRRRDLVGRGWNFCMPGHRLILRPMSKPGGALPARYTHCCICACPCSACCGFRSLLWGEY